MNNLPNGWQVKSLSELFDLKQGKHLPLIELNGGSYPVFGANGLVGYFNEFMYEEPTLLVTCRGATCGSINFTLPFSWVTGNAIALIPKEQINNSFFYYQLRNQSFSDVISGSAQPQIIVTTLSKKKILVPPLPIQKQIAEILEKADQAKQKRKEANKLTDEFMQSVFIEMFGDPVKNPMGWERVKAKKLFEIKLGKMRSEKHITGKHLKPYLRNINVQWGRLDLSDIKQMDFDPNEQKKYSLKKGDILVCEGGEVGRTAIWNGEVDDIYYQNALHRLRTKSDQINSMYFLYFMFFAAKYGLILRRTSVVTIAHFTAEKFNEFEIMLPPLQLQQQFAELVNKTEALKEKQKQSEREMENLFQSLMQKAFKGELVY
jgi:type I restriction enzyme S subunit